MLKGVIWGPVQRALSALFICVAIGYGPSVAADSGRAPLPPDFDRTMRQMMHDWTLPGVAVAVVRREGEPTIRTYGRRQWDRSEPITADTMFGIASNTKQFVSAAIALLAQDGSLSFDDPVIKHLPEFRVQDPWVTREVTIRDLLAHRSGIASHNDWLEEVASVDEQQLVRMLAQHGQSIPFRSAAEYNSYAFVVLAQIIERISGQPWGEFLHERIWRPLGMRHMAAHANEFALEGAILPTGDGWVEDVPIGFDALKADVDVAIPHVQWEAFYEGKAFYDPRELKNRAVHFHRTAIDPGQSAFASIADLATWARMLLAGGDERVLDPATIRQMLTLNSLTGSEWPHSPRLRESRDLDEIGYSLGIAQYRRGERVLYGHSGGELGFSSLFIVDPAAGVAVIALTNNLAYTSGAVYAIVQTVLDWHYLLPPIDWSRRFIETSRAATAANMARLATLWQSVPASRAGAPQVEAIIGRYWNDATGPLYIERRGKGLVASTGKAFDIELSHVGGNVYRGVVVSALRIGMVVTFDGELAGKVHGLRLGWASDIGQPGHDFVYTREQDR